MPFVLRGPLLAVTILALLTSCEALAGLTGTCQGPQLFGPQSEATNVAFEDDCEGPDAVYGDVYVITLTEQTNFLVLMGADGFRGQMVMYEGDYSALPATPRLIFDVVGEGDIGAKVYLPAGTYTIWAGSGERAGGTYTLTTTPTSSSPCSNLHFNYTVPGADISGQVLANDCPGGVAIVRQDAYGMWMQAGESVDVSLTMDKLGDMLWRRSGDPSALDVDSFSVPGDAVVEGTFTAPSAGLFSIHLLSYPNNLGAATYTLSVR